MDRTQCLFEYTLRSSQFEVLTWLLSSSLPRNQNIWICSVYDCFHWRKRALSFIIVLPTQNFRQQTECYFLILKVLFWTPQFLYQERNKWKMKSSKGTAQVLCIFGSPSLPCGSTQFLWFHLIGLPSTASLWHLPRHTSDDRKDIHMDASPVTLIALPPIQSYEKKFPTNKYFSFCSTILIPL